MNAGPPESNYGFWFPGKENDGAAGWQFMSAKYGRAWMGADVPRGPWNYDGEIDLGFGGALRMAATVVTRDPIFEWLAYGGTLTSTKNTLSVVPRDGLRQRFYAILGDPKNVRAPIRRLKIELDRDGFGVGQEIIVDKSLKQIAFTLENRTADAHDTGLWLSVPVGTSYLVLQNGSQVPLVETRNWDYPLQVELKVDTRPTRIEIIEKAICQAR